MSNFIEVQSVNKTYQRGEETLVVLDNLNLEVPRGDYLALMGPSGSGKSTLLNLIGGLDSPTSGEIIINGDHLEKMSASALSDWRASNIGFIFQFYNLLPVLTADKNVEINAGGDFRVNASNSINMSSNTCYIKAPYGKIRVREVGWMGGVFKGTSVSESVWGA